MLYSLDNFLGQALALPALFMLLLILLIVWSAIWKGLALWRAAKNGDTAWFVIMLVVNTVGILEILYLFVFGKKKTAT